MPQICPECGTGNANSARACTECQADLTVASGRCPRCGFEQPAANVTCVNCQAVVADHGGWRDVFA